MTDKAPAFQFYPKDFLSDENVRMMSMAERGVYITLLSLCWIEGSLPGTADQLARLCGIPLAAFRKLWPAIEKCFCEVGDEGRIGHARLEKERIKQVAFKRRQSDAAALRWDARRISQTDAALMPSQCSSSSSSSSKDLKDSSELKTAHEPPADDSPSLLVFPTVGSGGPNWTLTERRAAEWSGLFPNLEVLAEARKALAWIRANPGRRKTAKGMPKFLASWLTRATDSGPRRGLVAVEPTTRAVPDADATSRYLAELRAARG